jgi:hypothetical protein
MKRRSRGLVPVTAKGESSMLRHHFICFVLVAFVGCDHATTGRYAGPPLATVRGQMSLAGGVDLGSRPVRLSLAWFPGFAHDLVTPPKQLITQDLEYTGSFPQDFSFELYALPPADALLPVGDGSGATAAFGLLIAYQDLDGDRELTPSQDQPLKDAVLGTSVAAAPFDRRTADAYVIVWSDRASDVADGGFTLVRTPPDGGADEVLALATGRVPLVLGSDPRQGLWAAPRRSTWLPAPPTWPAA